MHVNLYTFSAWVLLVTNLVQQNFIWKMVVVL